MFVVLSFCTDALSKYFQKAYTVCFAMIKSPYLRHFRCWTRSIKWLSSHALCVTMRRCNIRGPNATWCLHQQSNLHALLWRCTASYYVYSDIQRLFKTVTDNCWTYSSFVANTECRATKLPCLRPRNCIHLCSLCLHVLLRIQNLHSKNHKATGFFSTFF